MSKLIQEIKEAVHHAAESSQKLAMFHFQVLRNATSLENVHPVEFCDAIGVPRSYRIEFRKMLSLALVMRQKNSVLVPKP